MIQQSVPARVSTLDAQYGQFRTGTVTAVNALTALVDVGGTPLRTSFLRGLAPRVGDTVGLVRQDATWVILGALSASGIDPVVNGSFEETNPATSLPPGWTLHDIAGAASPVVVEEPSAPVGLSVLEVGAATSPSDSYVYSEPWSVEVGAVWTLSAFVRGVYPNEGDPFTTDGALFGLWFANATDLYPTTSAIDTEAVTLTDLDETWRGISGDVTVPTGAAFLRLGLRSTLDGDAGIQWDAAAARETG